MREHCFSIDVHIFDTDCFGVMWHGAYIKWLEMGRVNLFKMVGVHLSAPNEQDGYIFPVVEQNLRFKSPARLNDILTLSSKVEVAGYKLIFTQHLINSETEKTVLEATTTVVVLDYTWKTLRRLPTELLEKLSLLTEPS